MDGEANTVERCGDADYRHIRRVATWLDDAFVIPGTRFSIGLDGLVGLVPGAGDLLTTLPALWIVLRALGLGVPRVVAGRMVLNILIDNAIGVIPVVGDLFDFAWKANRRNVELLERFQRDPGRTQRRSGVGLLAAAAALLLAAGVLIAIPVLVVVWLARG